MMMMMMMTMTMMTMMMLLPTPLPGPLSWLREPAWPLSRLLQEMQSLIAAEEQIRVRHAHDLICLQIRVRPAALRREGGVHVGQALLSPPNVPPHVPPHVPPPMWPPMCPPMWTRSAP